MADYPRRLWNKNGPFHCLVYFSYNHKANILFEEYVDITVLDFTTRSRGQGSSSEGLLERLWSHKQMDQSTEHFVCSFMKRRTAANALSYQHKSKEADPLSEGVRT